MGQQRTCGADNDLPLPPQDPVTKGNIRNNLHHRYPAPAIGRLRGQQQLSHMQPFQTIALRELPAQYTKVRFLRCCSQSQNVFSPEIFLDDFGTGYSSLSYLRMFPVDQLKIDRSFINNATTQQSSAAIAISVIALGRAMNLSVVAEGVENQAQLDFLRRNGCRIVQSYFFSRPLPAEGFEAFIRNWPPPSGKNSE